MAYTWPLAIRLGTAASDLGDPLLSAWILNWDQYAAFRFPLSIYHAPMFHPAQYALAFSENMFGIALASLPFYLIGLRPLAVFNLAMITGFAFCGYGAYVLGMTITRSRYAATLAGVLYAFVPFRIGHLAHIQIVWSGWLPLMLAAFFRYRKQPTAGRAALFGVCVLMNGLTNVHWLLFGTVAIGITMVVFALVDRTDVRFWTRLVIAGGLAFLLLVPILMPYRSASRLYDMRRGRGEAEYFSAVWYDWLVSADRNETYGQLPDQKKVQPERQLFPGLMLLFLTGAAFVLHRGEPRPEELAEERRIPVSLVRTLDVLIVLAAVVSYWGVVAHHFELRIAHRHLLSLRSGDLPVTLLLILLFVRLSLRLPKAWWWRDERPRSLRTAITAGRLPLELWTCVLWAAIGVVGSFGLNAFFHSVLFRYVEVFQALRVPARWSIIAYTGLAGTAALGAAALLERRRGWQRSAVAVALALAAWLDVRPALMWEHKLPGLDPVYAWLRDTPIPGASLEIPIERDMIEFSYLYASAEHHRPIMNGTSGFFPPSYMELVRMSKTAPIPDDFVESLQRNGCAVVIVHEDWLRELAAPVRAWLRRELGRGRLAFIRRFDHNAAGSWVFAVTRNYPNWRSAVPPLAPDGAGFLPQQNLERMLNDETTYISRTFGFVDVPVWRAWVRDPVTISGWAVSPNGIRSIEILAHSGKQRWRTERVPRPDVEAKYPWYLPGHVAGFTTTIWKRPRGIPPITDVQVEITDGLGHRTRLADLPVQWVNPGE